MAGYRFCRPDDIPLLVDAVNSCYHVHFPENRPDDLVSFKRDVRELDLWSSSCMIAFQGKEQIGVVLGCKRPPETLIYRIGMRSDFQRQGHAKHLLTSLSAKLSVLGPPTLVAEIPETDSVARTLFEALDFHATAQLVDLIWIPQPVNPAAAQLATRLPFAEIVDQGYLTDSALELEASCGWNVYRQTLLQQRSRLWITVITVGEAMRAYCISRLDEARNEEELVRFHDMENEEAPSLLFQLVHALAANSDRTLTVPGILADGPLFRSLKVVGFQIRRRFVRYEAKARAS